MFVNRQAELAFLNDVLTRNRPTAAQFILLYGRRRVGKTVLLRHWAENSGVDHVYWAAEKEPAALQRRKLFAQIVATDHRAVRLPRPRDGDASGPAVSSLWQADRSVATALPAFCRPGGISAQLVGR